MRFRYELLIVGVIVTLGLALYNTVLLALWLGWLMGVWSMLFIQHPPNKESVRSVMDGWLAKVKGPQGPDPEVRYDPEDFLLDDEIPEDVRR
jgi:hypothetical protein